MKNNWQTRLIGISLCLAMVFSLIPASAQATTDDVQMLAEVIDTQESVPVSKKEAKPLALTDIEEVEYYGRKALSSLKNADALLYAYDQFAAGVEASEATISVYNGTNAISLDEIKLVIDTYTRDYAHHFWLGNSYSISKNSTTVLSVFPKYTMSGAQLESAKQSFEQRANLILSGLTEDMSEYEIELYLHDKLDRKVSYINSANAHNAYGALIDGTAVCEGYSEAFQYLLQRAGIQSFIITGSSLNPGTQSYENHAWNMVRIDNEYYHTDSTWDDQGANLYHAYFNLSDEAILEDHVIDATEYPLPKCKSKSAQYFNDKAEYLDSYDATAVGKLLKDHHLTVHVYVPNDTNGFINWYKSNIREIAAKAGVSGGFSYGFSYLSHELILKITPAGNHSYNDYHVCTVCRSLEPGYTAGAGGFSVSLKGDIGLSYHMVLDKSILEDASAKVVFTIPDGENTYNMEILVNDAAEYDDLQVFSLNVAAAEMTSPITAKVVTASGESDNLTYSVKQYADYILDHPDLYPREQTLVKKMLHYGAAAQLYFDHRSDDLANADLNAESQIAIPETAETKMVIEGAVDGAAINGVSLVYRDKIAVRYYFTGDVSDKTFTVNDKQYQPVQKDDKYYVEIADILPQDLDEPITLTVTDAAQNTLTVSYNPMNYIVRMGQRGSEPLKVLLTALYNYHLEAKTYAGK